MCDNCNFPFGTPDNLPPELIVKIMNGEMEKKEQQEDTTKQDK